jgi:16S rRNA (guanine1207-N2)-methyltransferase
MQPKSFLPYTETQRSSASLHGEDINIITKPGLPGWNEISPATQLLAEQVKINPGDSILLLGGSQGLAVHLARQLEHGSLVINDNNHTTLEMTRLTLEANNISTYKILPVVELPSELSLSLNQAIIQIPKGRQLTRRWLIQVYHAIKIGGKVYMAGANNAGIQSAIRDAQSLFSNGRILGYRKGNRVVEFVKDAKEIAFPEWSETPGIAPGTWIKFNVHIGYHTFNVHSLPGVFSNDHLDEGTGMLLDAIRITPGEKILDVGCGYGIIGAYAASESAGTVHLVDNNLLAIASSQETLKQNLVSNAEVFTGDLLDPVGSQMYHQILSNPPFHAGFEVDYQIAYAMIKQSYHSLFQGGKLIIVANRFIRYMNLIKEIFGNVTIMKESEKYHVLSGLKSV